MRCDNGKARRVLFDKAVLQSIGMRTYERYIRGREYLTSGNQAILSSTVKHKMFTRS